MGSARAGDDRTGHNAVLPRRPRRCQRAHGRMQMAQPRGCRCDPAGGSRGPCVSVRCWRCDGRDGALPCSCGRRRWSGSSGHTGAGKSSRHAGRWAAASGRGRAGVARGHDSHRRAAALAAPASAGPRTFSSSGAPSRNMTVYAEPAGFGHGGPRIPAAGNRWRGAATRGRAGCGRPTRPWKPAARKGRHG